MNGNALKKEQRLANRKGVLFGASLWLQEDHLLSVHNMRFTEDYRRYYYKDILAIQTRRAARFSCSIPLLLAINVLLLIGFVFLRLPSHYVAVICAATLAALLSYQTYLVFFRSCVCHVVTAAGVDQIPALFRLKATRNAIKRIAERVEAVQGELTAGSDSQFVPVRSALPHRRPSTAAERLPDSRLRKGRFVASLVFLGTLADAFITFMQSNHAAAKILAWMAPINLLMVLLAGVAALMLLNPSKQFRLLRNVALACALFVVGISYTLGQVSAILVAFKRKIDPLSLSDYHKLASGVNIGGDLCVIAIAAVLMLRQRFRSSQQSAITTLGGI